MAQTIILWLVYWRIYASIGLSGLNQSHPPIYMPVNYGIIGENGLSSTRAWAMIRFNADLLSIRCLE